MKAFYAFLFGLCISTTAFAEPSEVILEACNSISIPKKRLECFKEAISPASARASTASTPLNNKPADTTLLTFAGAVEVCGNLLSKFRERKDLASEDRELSTPTELGVKYLREDGKPPPTCMVNRSTKKIVSIVTNGKSLQGAELAEMERALKQIRETEKGDYSNFVIAAKAAVTTSFKDPSSAQFRSLFVSGKTFPILCGEINGKNSYGAYIGFRRFYASDKASLTDIEDPKKNVAFLEVWPSVCEQKVVDIP